MKIKLSKIEDGTFNIREKADPDHLNELKISFEKDGQWDPVIVRPKGDKYEIISGHTRVQAAKELGWNEIEATVKDLEDVDALYLALKTNIVRKDMSEREQGLVLQKIIQTFNISQNELAKKLGKRHAWVDQRIRLVLNLHPSIIKALDEGKVTFAVASRVIATLPLDPQEQFLIYLLKNNIRGEEDAQKAKRRFLNKTLYTIGYEGKSIGDFVSILKHNEIENLIDIRFSNESQYKPEFNGNILKRELDRIGIKYIFKPDFGVPFDWQEPYKEGAITIECFEKYYRWQIQKKTNLKEFIDFIKDSGKSSLMCYEQYATPKRNQKIACHRSILSKIINESKEFEEIVDL